MKNPFPLAAASLALLALSTVSGVSSAAEVAVLKSSEATAWRPALDALRRSAPNVTFNEFDLRADRVEAERVIGTLRGRAVVFVAFGPLAAQAVKEVAPDVPLIFCMVQDPPRIGLTGAPNVTGVAANVPVKNQLAAFRTVYPRGVRVGVIYNAEQSGRLILEARKAAPVVRILLIDRAVNTEKDVPEALRGLIKGDQAIDALWIPLDPVILGDDTRRYLLSETLRAGKPVFSSGAALVPEGALVANGIDLVSVGEQAAELVQRIIGGEKAGRIDILFPRSELVINRKIADKLKIEIPADALRAANKLY